MMEKSCNDKFIIITDKTRVFEGIFVFDYNGNYIETKDGVIELEIDILQDLDGKKLRITIEEIE